MSHAVTQQTLPQQAAAAAAPAERREVVAATNEVVKVYGTGDAQVVAVDHISVQFARGSFTAIMGPSGSGKSTLMHCLAGLDHVTAGQVFLAGTELSHLPDKELTKVRRDLVGFIFQSFNLLPTLTAEQNILLPLELAGKKVDQAHFDQVVTSLGLGDRLSHRPSEMSGGQQQRVAIARALITKPAVIFADEPTGALDTKNGRALLGYLQHCSRDLGQTIVMVTHDPVAASYADRVLVLRDGRIVEDLDDPSADEIMQTMREQDALVEADTAELDGYDVDLTSPHRAAVSGTPARALTDDDAAEVSPR